MYLTKIIDYKKQELEHIRRKVTLQDVRLKAQDAGPARDFLGVVRGEGTRIIAEVKKASPSGGVIRSNFDPVKIAQMYEENGAAALSVLTDEHFFQGRLEHLTEIRARLKLPLLRKDFTFNEYQIHESRGAGADAVLLIVRILDDPQLKDFLDLSREIGMSALVEVHDEKDLERAAKIGAGLIGINNRDLDTLKVDLETSLRLGQKAPRSAVLVSESGISTRKNLESLQAAGIHVYLIGESLLREEDPGKKLKELLA